MPKFFAPKTTIDHPTQVHPISMNFKITGPLFAKYLAAFVVAFLTTLAPIFAENHWPNPHQLLAALVSGVLGLKLLAIPPPKA